jgi:ABC-2 type transport system ATP-binding protein
VDVERSAIECHGVKRQFGARVAVSDLDLTVPRGSVFGFLGPNGAGKTTTVRLLVGMLRPTAGTIQVLGKNPLGDGAWVRAHTGVMLDHVGLYDRLSAWQNLYFAVRVARLSASEGHSASRRCCGALTSGIGAMIACPDLARVCDKSSAWPEH